jgi:hypothetical protein
MVVVELGEPGVPVVCICALAEGATATTTAANIPKRKICLADFIGEFDLLLLINSSDWVQFVRSLPSCLWDFRAMLASGLIVQFG